MTIHAKHRAARKPLFSRGARTLTMAGTLALGSFALSAPAAQAQSVWDDVAACESGGNWSINTGNGFYGGLQFTSSTWAGFGGTAYASQANLASKSQQIKIAQRVLDGQGPGAWPTCSVKAGLTRSNGGASSSRGTEREAAPTEAAPQQQEPAPQQSAPKQESAPSQSAASTQAAAPVASGPVTRYVSADTAAYVRSGPSFDNAVIDKAARGTKVSGPVVNGWVKIGEGRYIGNSVLSSSVVGGSAASSAGSSTGTVTQYVTADIRAYVRSGPSYDNAVIDKVDRGTAVSGTWTNGWLKIGEGQYIGKTMLAANAN